VSAPPLRVEWLGRLPYAEAHARMSQQLARRLAGEVGDSLLLCEHDPVYTVGRRREAAANVLQPGDVPVVEVERGGDVTFHGPGQLVGYPVCLLPEHRHDLHAWLRGLEEVCATTIGRWGLDGVRDERNTGTWVDGRKIAAIGIACRRWVTWHGFAININVDLEPFARIHPCGMESSLVTRMSDHLERPPKLAEVRDATGAAFRAWWRDWASPTG
jgi:lipoyl(octanoyl) transferase